MLQHQELPIETNTLSSTAASVTFSSIAGTYKDLVVVVAGTFTTGATNNVNLQCFESGARHLVFELTFFDSYSEIKY